MLAPNNILALSFNSQHAESSLNMRGVEPPEGIQPSPALTTELLCRVQRSSLDVATLCSLIEELTALAEQPLCKLKHDPLAPLRKGCSSFRALRDSFVECHRRAGEIWSQMTEEQSSNYLGCLNLNQHQQTTERLTRILVAKTDVPAALGAATGEFALRFAGPLRANVLHTIVDTLHALWGAEFITGHNNTRQMHAAIAKLQPKLDNSPAWSCTSTALTHLLTSVEQPGLISQGANASVPFFQNAGSLAAHIGNPSKLVQHLGGEFNSLALGAAAAVTTYHREGSNNWQIYLREPSQHQFAILALTLGRKEILDLIDHYLDGYANQHNRIALARQDLLKCLAGFGDDGLERIVRRIRSSDRSMEFKEQDMQAVEIRVELGGIPSLARESIRGLCVESLRQTSGLTHPWLSHALKTLLRLAPANPDTHSIVRSIMNCNPTKNFYGAIIRLAYSTADPAIRQSLGLELSGCLAIHQAVDI